MPTVRLYPDNRLRKAESGSVRLVLYPDSRLRGATSLFPVIVSGGSLTYQDTGGAIGAWVGAGADAVVIADLGGAIGAWVGSGVDVIIAADSGGAIGEWVGGGSEGLIYSDLGGAVSEWVGGGEDDYTAGTVTVPLGGGARWNEYNWKKYRKELEEQAERYEMKLSEELAKRLEESQQRELKALQMSKELLDTNANLMGTITAIKGEAVVVPQKPPLDPFKKAELMDRLQMARIVKEQKKQEREAFAQQRLKNLAKARKVAQKN